MRFTGERMNHREVNILKYPGGEIPLNMDGGNNDIEVVIEYVRERLDRKGFNEKAIEGVLFSLYGGVSSETTVPMVEVVDGLLELVGSEVRE